MYVRFVALYDYIYKPDECSFHSNECKFDDRALFLWVNADDNQFGWLPYKGETPSLGTETNGDHSMFDYLFL